MRRGRKPLRQFVSATAVVVIAEAACVVGEVAGARAPNLGVLSLCSLIMVLPALALALALDPTLLSDDLRHLGEEGVLL